MALTTEGPSAPPPGSPSAASAARGLRQPGPTVLLVTAYRWRSSARVAMSFAEAGWRVEAMCPRGHILEGIRAVGRLHVYRFFGGDTHLRRVIARVKPDLVVPCDDLTAGQLRHLCHPASSAPGAGALCALLRRSFGDACSFAEFDSRSRIAGIATELGLAAPDTSLIRTVKELEGWIGTLELPAVLKTDGSSGGYGVRLVSSLAEAKRAFRELRAPIGVLRGVKRAIVDRAETFLMPALKRERPAVNIQRYVRGEEVTCTAACWQGAVLGTVALQVLQTSGPVGHSTVLRVIDHPEISEAIRKLAKRLGVSGLYGFDFILEEKTGRPFLLEINPRATQTTHLGLLAGCDLALALRHALAGEGSPARGKGMHGETIALFPQEWLRDPESGFLRTAYHDVPRNEPEFVKDCLLQKPESLWGSALDAEMLAALAAPPADRVAAGSKLEHAGRP